MGGNHRQEEVPRSELNEDRLRGTCEVRHFNGRLSLLGNGRRAGGVGGRAQRVERQVAKRRSGPPRRKPVTINRVVIQVVPSRTVGRPPEQEVCVGRRSHCHRCDTNRNNTSPKDTGEFALCRRQFTTWHH